MTAPANPCALCSRSGAVAFHEGARIEYQCAPGTGCKAGATPKGCSQCGQPWSARACGPTHAAVFAQREHAKSQESPTPGRVAVAAVTDVQMRCLRAMRGSADQLGCERDAIDALLDAHAALLATNESRAKVVAELRVKRFHEDAPSFRSGVHHALDALFAAEVSE